ncbi:MAG: hypothetical protein QOF59_2160 [Actinomycetota bacterium]|nr:hypothetical protein [Actinomycetota bacterium]
MEFSILANFRRGDAGATHEVTGFRDAAVDLPPVETLDAVLRHRDGMAQAGSGRGSTSRNMHIRGSSSTTCEKRSGCRGVD